MTSHKPTLKIQLLELVSRLCERFAPQGSLRIEYTRARQDAHTRTPGNPAAHGYKIYSQCDEDGIVAYIFSIIGYKDKIFVEIGCSDGLENNTHTLLLDGWRGVWIDASQKKINFIKRELPINSKLVVQHAMISEANVCDEVEASLAKLGAHTIDFFSLDIDGQDLYVLRSFLAKYKPRVICVEYNAKFRPPLEVFVGRNTSEWNGDDYQGASLCSFVKVLNAAGYALKACGISGVNAFFVTMDDAEKLPAFTPEQLYQPARYNLRHLRSGHRPSLKFLHDALLDESPRSNTVP